MSPSLTDLTSAALGRTGGAPRALTVPGPAEGGQKLTQWKLGQVLDAVVTSSAGNRVNLSIQGQALQAESPVPLPQGSALRLQVESLEPRPVLRMLDTGKPDIETLRQALREFLPRQPEGAINRLLDTLTSPIPPRTPQTLPRDVQATLQTLQNRLPDLKDLSDPAKLQTALRDSGLFLEQRLSKGELPGSDLKLQLLQLRQALDRLLGQNTASASTPRSAPAQTAAPPPGSAASGTSALPLPSTGTAGTPPGQTAPQTPGAPLPSSPTTPASNTPASAAASPPQAASRNATGMETALTTPASVSPAARQYAQAAIGAITGGAGETAELPDSRQMAAQLRREVDTAIAAIHVNQVRSASGQEQGQPVWLFSIPFLHDQRADTLEIRLRRDDEAQGGSAGEPGWRLDFDLMPPGLGPLHVSLILRGDRLNTRLWAESGQTVQRIRENLDTLRAALTTTGLDISHLECYPGAPRETPGQTPEGIPEGGLLNLKA